MTLGLFAGVGVELEYMVVDAKTLDVRPIVDRILTAAAGADVSDYEPGHIGWANELVKHVIEIRNDEPDPSLDGLSSAFQKAVADVSRFAQAEGARLLPTGMHPWMDPAKEAVLWDREYRAFYEAFDRIFDCRRHGWANIQSCQLNLPFDGDEEFARLHAAIRFLLPILPALATSTPLVEGRLTAYRNNRLVHYRVNAAAVPAINGRCIPEFAASRAEYEKKILAPIGAAIAPHDPDEKLRDEWVNARGAIARFDRNAIEIRLLDMQECPAADIAVCRGVASAVRAVVEGRWGDPLRLNAWDTVRLAELLDDFIRDAEETFVDDEAYLNALGFPDKRATGRDLWRHLVGETVATGTADERADHATLTTILNKGTLGTRIREALGNAPARERIRDVYGALAAGLLAGRPFLP